MKSYVFGDRPVEDCHADFLRQEWLTRMVMSYTVGAMQTLPPDVEQGLLRLVASNWACCYHCFLPLQLRGDLLRLVNDTDFMGTLRAFGIALQPGVRGRRGLDHSSCKERWSTAHRLTWARALLISAVQVAEP